LNSLADAQEVAQEAYVRLLRLKQPEGISFQRALLFRIAGNLSVDRIRARRVRERAETEETSDPWQGQRFSEDPAMGF
jgi:RNA polymerase sigma-70 factor (ECF subfamily)